MANLDAWITTGGLTAGLIAAVVLVAKGLSMGISRFAGQRIAASLFSRGPSIRRRMRNRYAKQVLKDDIKQSLGFLEAGFSVDRFYVPLQCFGANDRQEDAYVKIRDELRTIILGSAGAGKSMFLKHQLVQWAKTPSAYQRIPVLVQLYEYDSPTKSLRNLVVSRMARRGMKVKTPPDAFLDRALSGGRLSLFLDGLDEVVSSRRSGLIAEIIELAEQNPKTQVIVTSRGSVYNGELRPIFANEVRVADFAESDMRAFLRLWFASPPIGTEEVERKESSHPEVRAQVDKLMTDLQGNPPLHQLARSPLLLTMIASLETVDPGLGPSVSRSRADFYRILVQHMLRRDKDLRRLGSISVYRAAHKQAALASIALMAQGGTGNRDDDRGVSEYDALERIGEVLKRLNMSPTEHSNSMLGEIVERSELLRRVGEQVGDGALIFTHVTIQEYMAAVQLRDDPRQLLNLYNRTPHRWMESVKLWCGADHDSTYVVRELVKAGPDGKLLVSCV